MLRSKSIPAAFSRHKQEKGRRGASHLVKVKIFDQKSKEKGGGALLQKFNW